MLVAFAALAALVAAGPSEPPVVCIDPGHPSETSAGAHAGKLSENDINWTVAQRLAKVLKADGIRYVMTKHSRTERVTNRRRAEIANEAHAALFLRLHCDYGTGNGFACYYPDREATKQGVTGPPAEVRAESKAAAEAVNAAMTASLHGKLPANPVHTDAATFVGGKQGGVLTGSIFARVPTVLVEMCYLNQPPDARFIASPTGQDQMARALAAGIHAWLGRSPQAAR